MSISPIPGATVIAFDHHAATIAISQVNALIGTLTATRNREMLFAAGAVVDWSGPSRSSFDSRSSGFRLSIDRAISDLNGLIREIETQRARASSLQDAANADELRARAVELTRLEAAAEAAA